MLIESGVRIHATSFMRDKPNVPSGFTIKLRKHIRTRRLNDVQQLGVDRVVDLTFGSGEGCYHVLVEFYASGNIILTDGEYTILNVLRQHAPDEAYQHHVGDKYPTESARGQRIILFH